MLKMVAANGLKNWDASKACTNHTRNHRKLFLDKDGLYVLSNTPDNCRLDHIASMVFERRSGTAFDHEK
jgi:hypothetical protein